MFILWAIRSPDVSAHEYDYYQFEAFHRENRPHASTESAGLGSQP